jgi:tetratricopeptide (TPR) repeat protein
MRQIPEAIALYQAVLAREPQNLRATTGLAQAYITDRQYPQAIAIYDQLIAAEPNNTAYQISRARTIGYSRQYPAAIAALRPIVAAEPANSEARLTLAEVLTNSGDAGNRREAITQYQTVLRTEPENVDARVGLGRVYSYTRNYNAAERELRSVLAKYPDNPDALYALAETQRFSGQPFEAAGNYERVLRIQPTNSYALQNLELVRRETAPMVTVSGRGYHDTNGVSFRTFTFGPTFPTRFGTIGLTVESGRFEDDGVELRRRALNLLLARRFGPIQARLIVSRVRYSAAPDKSLFDLLLQRTQGSRDRVFFNVRELDIIESLGAVQSGIKARQWRVGYEHPLGDRVDLDLEGRYYQFNDSNRRNTLLAAIYYRLRPQSPTLRVGLQGRIDDTRFTSPLYYTPQNLRSVDLVADYTIDSGRFRAGLSTGIPLAGRSDAAGGGDNRRDSKTLFGYMNYDLSELIELFINGGIVRSSTFDSNDLTLGANIRFR